MPHNVQVGVLFIFPLVGWFPPPAAKEGVYLKGCLIVAFFVNKLKNLLT